MGWVGRDEFYLWNFSISFEMGLPVEIDQGDPCKDMGLGESVPEEGGM